MRRDNGSEKVARMEAACRRKNIRLTAQRRTIIRTFTACASHPTVEELHRRSSAENNRISLATVYRTIKILEENEVIERHMFLETNRFEESRTHHDHFIDVTSGRIIEFRNDDIEKLQRQVARKYGFEIIRHRLDIYVKPMKKTKKKAYARRR